MTIELRYANAMVGRVGEQQGIRREEIDAIQPAAKAIHTSLGRMRRKGDIGFYELPHDRDSARESKDLAQHVRKKFDNFVVLGIGGSALGPLCIHTALAHPHHNLLSKKKRRGAPRMFFLDNVDPETMGRLEEVIDLKRTFFSVVSKSGSTPETAAQLMAFHAVVARKVGRRAADNHFAATTDPENGPLLKLAGDRDWEVLTIPANVGGRFSVLSSVGLFPAAVQGISINALLRGAAEMEERCRAPAVWKNPAYLYGAIHYLADTRRGKSIAVMMPYSNALRDLADWHRQLWAESLGQKHDVAGARVFTGQTPVKALGATDQHSQVQLYVEGPNDKIFTFIGVDKFRKAFAIRPGLSGMEGLSYLHGHDMGKLLNEELNATEFALSKAYRPNLRFQLDKVSAENLGGMFLLLQAATAFNAGLYNINGFDQRGVEAGKQATAALMGRDTPEDRALRREIAEQRKGAGKWKI